MPDIEWVSLPGGRVVVATAQDAWVHRPRFGDPWGDLTRPMTGPGSADTTRRLLDGALAAAATRRGPPTPPADADAWVFRLISLYVTTRATPPRMARVAERFEAEGREALAAWARGKVIDEHGHDTLALRDLAALGYDAEALVAAVQPRRAAAVVACFDRLVEAPDPIGTLGYAYALERLAANRTRAYVDGVQAMLGDVRATRCLRVHSAAGSDVDHVDDLVDAVAPRTAEERRRVALACHETARILFDPALVEPLGAGWVARIAPFRAGATSASDAPASPAASPTHHPSHHPENAP